MMFIVNTKRMFGKMEKGKNDDFRLAISTDKNFALWYVLATLFVLDFIVKSEDFKGKCLESYKKAMAEKSDNGQ